MDTVMTILYPNVKAYVEQFNCLARRWNCQELDAENLSIDDRIRLMEKVENDIMPGNLERDLPAEAIRKKRVFLNNVTSELVQLGKAA